MSNIQFGDLRHGCYGLHVMIIETVAGVDLHAQTSGTSHTFSDFLQGKSFLIFMSGDCIKAGMELNDIGTCLRGCFNLFLLGVNK